MAARHAYTPEPVNGLEARMVLSHGVTAAELARFLHGAFHHAAHQAPAHHGGGATHGRQAPARLTGQASTPNSQVVYINIPGSPLAPEPATSTPSSPAVTTPTATIPPASLPTVTSVPRVAGVESAVEQQIVTPVNQQRALSGLAPLQVNAKLVQGAQIQAAAMAQLGVMSHDLPGAALPTLADRFSYVGYNYSSGGENIAEGYVDANAVMAGWMNSPGHRANILEPSFTEIGVGVAYDGSGLPYYCQEFGRPA